MSARNFDISAPELKARLDRGDNLILLDVREPFEYDLCHLSGATLIPMNELPTRLHELDEDQEMVVYCHAGVRSARVVSWLWRQGFTKAVNLAGGIDAWSCQVDANLPRY